MYDASDRKQVRRAEKAAALQSQNDREVLVALARTEPGRRWLWDWLERLHVFSSTFNDDAARSAFAEGQRSTGLELLAGWMEAAPDQFIQAMREANVRRSSSGSKSGANGQQPGGEEPGREPEGFSEPEAGAEA